MNDHSPPPSSSITTMPSTQPPKWQPLNSRQRRVFGVLIEKAKTVPDSYPMTLNGLVNGCNQKSNREPQMELSEDEVQQAIDEVRAMGAAMEVQGSGRVAKYKHLAYEWLGVDKVEIAVMTELLLRGEQTVGELRGRAARMEAIPDMNALQQVLQSLRNKKLIVELTPPGRGQIVTHNLYKEREMNELKAHYANAPAPPSSASSDDDPAPRPAVARSSGGFSSGVTTDMFSELRVEVAELRAEVARLRTEVRDLQEKLA